MAIFLRDDDTICALATAPGYGAVAVVRVSGPAALSISRKIAPFLPDPILSHSVHYGHLKGHDGRALDEVLVTYFAAGRSFTTQETIEISCHGSEAISGAILRELVLSGARMATPGEFTYRAFAGGRIDLTQAEAVLSLVQSHSEVGTRAALRVLSGGLSAELRAAEEDLIWALSRLEANIDFASEDIEFAKADEILSRVVSARKVIHRLIKSYAAGRVMKDGLRVAIVGPANAGKSSILNRLVGEDRAIVSNRPGTTRDRIDATIVIDGMPFTFSDTAGLRDTTDEIEALGIERSRDAVLRADIVLLVSSPDGEAESVGEIDFSVGNRQVISVLNKSDLISNQDQVGDEKMRTLSISAKTGEGFSELLNTLKRAIPPSNETDSAAVLQVRQFELLKKADLHVGVAETLLAERASPEFSISEIQEALYSVMEILGRRFDDEVLDRVFRDFCLGK